MISHLIERQFVLKDLMVWAVILLIATGNGMAAPARPSRPGAPRHAIGTLRRTRAVQPHAASVKNAARPERYAARAIRGSLQ